MTEVVMHEVGILILHIQQKLHGCAEISISRSAQEDFHDPGPPIDWDQVGLLSGTLDKIATSSGSNEGPILEAHRGPLGPERSSLSAESEHEHSSVYNAGGTSNASVRLENDSDDSPELLVDNHAANQAKASSRDQAVTIRSPSTGVDSTQMARTQRSTSCSRLKRKSMAIGKGNVKRKRRRQSLLEHSESINKRDISTFLKQIVFIPKDVHQPEEIYALFSGRGIIDDRAVLKVLTGLFVGIASPRAFDQFRNICTSLRKSPVLPTRQATRGLRQVVQALDSLNAHVFVVAALRRYFLMSLKTCRMELEEQQQQLSPTRTRPRRVASSSKTIRESDPSYDRVDTRALRQMMAESYPELQATRAVRGGLVDEYQRKLQALKDRIRSGRNWKILQECFGASILVLIPPRDEYDICDSE